MVRNKLYCIMAGAFLAAAVGSEVRSYSYAENQKELMKESPAVVEYLNVDTMLRVKNENIERLKRTGGNINDLLIETALLRDKEEALSQDPSVEQYQAYNLRSGVYASLTAGFVVAFGLTSALIIRRRILRI